MADLILALSLAAAAQTAADSPMTGLWATSEDGGRVRIEACSDAPRKLCGELMDAQILQAEPDRRDINNPDEALRERPLRGVRVIDRFERGEDGEWTPGVLYDPEEGRNIRRGHITLVDEDRLEVRGCVTFICRTQVWTRIEDGA
ncbi:MAG: DUF2147 domain-containing protein [Oceanicaulis sp.]